MSREPYAGIFRCRKCGRPQSRYDVVRLWDGHEYCADCVDSAHPGMTTFARSNRRLQETMPWPATEVAARIGRKAFFCGLLFVCSLPLLAWLLRGGEAFGDNNPIAFPLGFLVFLACLSTAVARMYSWFLPPFFEAQRLTVSIEACRLILFNRRHGEFANVPLAICDWYLGKMRQDRLL